MTNAELTVLSLIVECPRHGYAIESVIEERGMREWTDVGFSSIYYLLKKLERSGYIVGRQEGAHQGPTRTTFVPTDAGRQAFHGAILEAMSRPERSGSGFLIALAQLPALEPHEAVQAVSEYRQLQNDRIEELRQKRTQQEPLPDHVTAMFEYSETLLKAEVEWISTYTKQLEGRVNDQH